MFSLSHVQMPDSLIAPLPLSVPCLLLLLTHVRAHVSFHKQKNPSVSLYYIAYKRSLTLSLVSLGWPLQFWKSFLLFQLWEALNIHLIFHYSWRTRGSFSSRAYQPSHFWAVLQPALPYRHAPSPLFSSQQMAKPTRTQACHEPRPLWLLYTSPTKSTSISFPIILSISI